jgi:hypothetical protein
LDLGIRLIPALVAGSVKPRLFHSTSAIASGRERHHGRLVALAEVDRNGEPAPLIIPARSPARPQR